MVMNKTFDHVVRRLTDYVTRVRKPAQFLMMAGGGILLANGIWLNFPLSKLVWSSGEQSLEISADPPSDTILLIQIVIGCLFLIAGAVWAYRDQQEEKARIAREVTIVIESRGLRDEDGRSLKNAVSAETRARVDELPIDLRRFNRDGMVVDPEGAANEIMQVHQDLRRRRLLRDRQDISLVYGGLTPVPFTFLIGVLMDDQGPVATWDWDRTQQAWRKVEGPDDGRRFNLTWNPPTERPKEVVVAVSSSYPILDENLARSFPGIPVMRLDLQGRGQDSHWSEEKQAALATQFLEALKDLEALGVETVRLVIAAQNSLVFRLGSRFERRNVPNAVVYQFERDADPPFPWGVQLPAPGATTVIVQRTDL